MRPRTDADWWSRQSGRLYAVLIAVLLSTRPTHAAWQVQQETGPTELKLRCYLQSETKTLSDGYQETRAFIRIEPNRVRVTTEAPIDKSFADVGMQVDQHAFIPMDAVHAHYTAQFVSSYVTIIKQFIRGYKARVQLRFWPTWPATGTHAVTFSLIGFSKAYEEIKQKKDCWTLENQI